MTSRRPRRILLGRTTYEMFEPGWSTRTVEDDPGAPFFNDTTKCVVSGTLAEATWRNSKIFGPYDPDAIRSLKDGVDGDLYVSGSGTLVRAMLADGLVDGALPRANVFGGEGNDTLTGGDGDDQAFGQSGNDRMIWNPGDDTDLNEGGDGTDTVEVNGGNGAEQFTATANGTRVRFDRVNPAPFALDIGTSEKLTLNANGGDDSFSATGNLAPLIAITVDGGTGNDTLLGSNGADTLLGGDDIVTVSGAGPNAQVSGLAPPRSRCPARSRVATDSR
ncbi:MAG: hypothetical protein QOE53_2899 [Pseudonocardiales bacterium]|nr:hypothetical protein [Pseudonocardiales bacterium]